MDYKTLEAVRKSRLHWYSNWAKLVSGHGWRQLGCDNLLYLEGSYEPETDDVICVQFGSSNCTLCPIFYPEECEGCPLGNCEKGSLWFNFAALADKGTDQQKTAAARALYERLDTIYQDNRR